MKRIPAYCILFLCFHCAAQEQRVSTGITNLPDIPSPELKLPDFSSPMPLQFSVPVSPKSIQSNPDVPFAGLNLHPANTTPPFSFDRNPYALDFGRGDAITTWDTGMLAGSSSRTTLPGLFSGEQAAFSFTQQFGNLTATFGASAHRFQLQRGLQTSFGVHGSLNYQIDERLSLNVFGSYQTNPFYYSPATLPYIGSSEFGGCLNMQFSDHFGMAMGAKQSYDPYSRKWMTVPIITPYFKLNSNVQLGVDVGWLVGRLLDKAFNNGEYYSPHNPSFAPPFTPMPPVR